jgi:hypothetical protein
MTTNILTIGGIDYVINDPEDLQKALGIVQDRKIIMTDESGAVIGFGNSIASVNKSMPLIKALKEDQVKPHANKPILFTKPKISELERLAQQMNGLKKSLTVNVDDDGISERLDTLAATINQVTDYLEVLISRGILPART